MGEDPHGGGREAGSRSGADSPGPIETARIKEMTEELRPVVEREAEWLRSSEGDFMRLFRFNILVLAAYVSIASLSFEVLSTGDGVAGVVDRTGLVVFGGALFLWFASTAIAVIAYGSLEARLGSERLFRRDETGTDWFEWGEVDDLSLEDTVLAASVRDLNADSYYERVLEDYLRANQQNHTEARLRFGLYLVSLTLLVLSIALFVSEWWTAVFGGHQAVMVGQVIVGVFGVVLALLGGGVGVTKLYDKYHDG